MKQLFLFFFLATLLVNGIGCSRRVSLDRTTTSTSSAQTTPLVHDRSAASMARKNSGSSANLVTGSTPTYGDRYGIRLGYQACMTHQPESTSTAGHRQDCADEEFDFQDARLNRVYRRAMSDLERRDSASGKRAAQLRVEQRKWLSQLDEACAKAAEQAGSAMGPAAQSTCMMNMTARRADELERTYPEAVK